MHAKDNAFVVIYLVFRMYTYTYFNLNTCFILACTIYIYNLYYSILYYIILYYIILYGLGVFSRPGETLFLPIILGLSSSLDASSPYMLMHVMFWYCDMYIYIHRYYIYICTPSGVINRGLLEKDFPRYESPCSMQFPNIFQLATGDTDVYSKLFNHYKQTPTA